MQNQHACSESLLVLLTQEHRTRHHEDGYCLQPFAWDGFKSMDGAQRRQSLASAGFLLPMWSQLQAGDGGVGQSGSAGGAVAAGLVAGAVAVGGILDSGLGSQVGMRGITDRIESSDMEVAGPAMYQAQISMPATSSFAPSVSGGRVLGDADLMLDAVADQFSDIGFREGQTILKQCGIVLELMQADQVTMPQVMHRRQPLQDDGVMSLIQIERALKVLMAVGWVQSIHVEGVGDAYKRVK